jgi:diguanylate cyclase (GGDEF)-like protein/PAS domain S-box-containing protein
MTSLVYVGRATVRDLTVSRLGRYPVELSIGGNRIRSSGHSSDPVENRSAQGGPAQADIVGMASEHEGRQATAAPCEDRTPGVREPAEGQDVVAQHAAARRERRTERLVATAFVVCAGTMAVALPTDGLSIPVAAWFVGLCFVLLQIEFEVGEGRTRPVQLALVPMFVLVPPALVPCLVAVAHVLARLPESAVERRPLDRLSSTLADGWFTVGPALVLVIAGSPGGFWSAAGALSLALAAQVGFDFAAAAIRLRVGLQLSMRDQLAAFAWVYFVDVLLTPVGVLAAVAAQHGAWIVAAVLPLAALLAVFARERHGRIENARELHRMAEENEARLQSIVQNSSDLIAIVGHDGVIRTLTGATEPVFGAERESAIGRPLEAWAHPDDVPLLRALLARVASAGPQSSHEGEWRILRANGAHGYVETVATNLLGDDRVRGIVLTARDIDDRRAFEEQLRHRAFHDPLTQLANRALFYDRIEHALTREAREDQQVALMFLDLDDFKVVNDEMGHAVGDELLVGVAGRLRGALRSADTVARLGGDEFGVLLEHVAGPNEVVQAADRLLMRFDEPFIVHGEPHKVNLSIGIAVSANGERSVDEMLRRADLAMYAAKRDGKHRWDLYDRELEGLAPSAQSEESERATWFQRGAEQREEIVGLLERPDAIRMAFQPILDLRSGTVAGYESLARFSGPETRPPNAWFAQAHRCGLGYELEARAVAAALATPGRPPGTYLTVNLSPSALVSVPVQAVLPPSLDEIVIELTENELLTDAPGLEAALADVRRRGGRVAIDDAGAGYAGLKHVMRLGPDLIKLDRSLVAGVADDPGRAALIASFVRYGRASGAVVCAEGIETLGDLTELADLDVGFGQGYVIARPSADWPAAAPAASDACSASFTAALAAPVPTSVTSLEDVLALVASARDRDDVAGAVPAIAAELSADLVRIEHVDPVTGARHGLTEDGPATPLDEPALAQLASRETVQVLAGDPRAGAGDLERLSDLRHRSLLRVPVLCRGTVIGTVEAFRSTEKPWSRNEISSARIIAHQLGASLILIDARPPARALKVARAVSV